MSWLGVGVKNSVRRVCLITNTGLSRGRWVTSHWSVDTTHSDGHQQLITPQINRLNSPSLHAMVNVLLDDDDGDDGAVLIVALCLLTVAEVRPRVTNVIVALVIKRPYRDTAHSTALTSSLYWQREDIIYAVPITKTKCISMFSFLSVFIFVFKYFVDNGFLIEQDFSGKLKNRVPILDINYQFFVQQVSPKGKNRMHFRQTHFFCIEL